MPRIERNIAPGTVHHIYNRGINKMTIFYSNKDYDRFIEKIFYFKDKYKVKILAFALLPNHWHLLAKESESTPGVVDMIRCLCNAYVKYFNIYEEIWTIVSESF
jgi:putative transposase